MGHPVFDREMATSRSVDATVINTNTKRYKSKGKLQHTASLTDHYIVMEQQPLQTVIFISDENDLAAQMRISG